MKPARNASASAWSVTAMRASARAGLRRIGWLKTALAVLLLGASSAHAYVGSFEPYPRKNPHGFMHVVFEDTQFNNFICPGAMACVIRRGAVWHLIAPISAGPGQIVNLAIGLGTPDAILGHEMRHIWDDDFHPALLPFVDLPSSDMRIVATTP